MEVRKQNILSRTEPGQWSKTNMSDLSPMGSYSAGPADGETPGGLVEILMNAFRRMQNEEETTERYNEDNGINTSYIFSPSTLPYGAVMLIDDYKGSCVVPYTFALSAAAMIETALVQAKGSELFTEENPYHRLHSHVTWGQGNTVSTIFSVDKEGRGFYTVSVMREGELSETFCIHHQDFSQFVTDVKAVMELEDKWHEEATGRKEESFRVIYEDKKANIARNFEAQKAKHEFARALVEMFTGDDDEDEANKEGFQETMPSLSDLPVAMNEPTSGGQLPEHLM